MKTSRKIKIINVSINTQIGEINSDAPYFKGALFCLLIGSEKAW
jgi:hypothetical protein